MPIRPDDFFEQERPWSWIKNQILASYLNPYIRIISRLNRPLWIIDAFAGSGKNEQTNDPGSPLIILKALKKYEGESRAVLINDRENHHNKLSDIVQAGGWKNAETIRGDANHVLREVIYPQLVNESILVYIDPFGLDIEFNTLRPLIERTRKIGSTELLINLNASGLHRLAARNAINEGTADPAQIEVWHLRLTKALGGEYWRDILLPDNGMNAKERETAVVDEYRRQLGLSGHLRYSGACPVQENRDGATKYYLIFASGHEKALKLINDEMCKSFQSYMFQHEMKDTLFADQSWTDWRDTKMLQVIVKDYIRRYPHLTREELWIEIIQHHFMQFLETEFRQAVKDLCAAEEIICTTPIKSKTRPTKGLNDRCQFRVVE